MTALDTTQLVRQLAVMQVQVKAATRKAMVTAADDLVARIVPITPLEEGPLSASVRRTEPQVSAGGVTIAVGAGSGASAVYAVPQHENAALRHDPGRTHHYVSRPTAQHGPRLLAAVQAAVKRVLG